MNIAVQVTPRQGADYPVGEAEARGQSTRTHTIVGALGIIGGIIGLVAGLSLIALLIHGGGFFASSPQAADAKWNEVMYGFLTAEWSASGWAVCFTSMSLGLPVIGLGLVCRLAWARRAARIWSVVAIAGLALSVTLLWLLPVWTVSSKLTLTICGILLTIPPLGVLIALADGGRASVESQ